ncbi:Hypothetical predicted protein [Pelobates cultripes]|uniref:Uncharacterized protein n=1 Tax=Pelobates cultripes TaxID=61616 RepID=A0AAD1T3V0_PELCU|nr:Hypothetical predicted protein [Pelobates cultripes]
MVLIPSQTPPTILMAMLDQIPTWRPISYPHRWATTCPPTMNGTAEAEGGRDEAEELELLPSDLIDAGFAPNRSPLPTAILYNGLKTAEEGNTVLNDTTARSN